MKRGLCKSLIVCVVMLLSAAVTAQPRQADYTANDLTRDAEKFGVDEQLGSMLPLDTVLINSEGKEVTLESYFAEGKPLLLVPQYFECPMLCGLIMSGVTRVVDALELSIGTDYQFLGVSIDHEEDHSLAASKERGYAQAYNRPGGESGWHFAVGEQSQIARLMEAIGYNFSYDQDRDEFAHSAAIVIVTPDGTISRYLYGIDFNARDLRLALVEASEGKIGSFVDRLMLYCYHYDPQTRTYSLFATRLMRAAALITVVVIVALIASGLRRREQG